MQILLLAQHVSGTTMPIIRTSSVLYSDCRLWCLVLWFSSCWSGVELRVMFPVCRMLQQNYCEEKEDTFVVTVNDFVHYNPMNLYYMSLDLH